MIILEILIEKKRKKMIDLANQFGLTAQKTVHISKELDQLIIIYQKIVITGKACYGTSEQELA